MVQLSAWLDFVRQEAAEAVLIQTAVNKQTVQSDRYEGTQAPNRCKQATSNTCRATSG